jgi:hypothetical protein
MSMPMPVEISVEIDDSHAKLKCSAMTRTVLVDSHNRLRRVLGCGAAGQSASEIMQGTFQNGIPLEESAGCSVRAGECAGEYAGHAGCCNRTVIFFS